jgi:hypothetical protein
MVRVVGAALLLGLFSLSIAACSGTVEDGDDDMANSTAGTSSSPPKTSPLQKCQTYASTWCNKAFGCYVQVGRLDEGSRQYNVDECTRLIVEKFPCSAVTSASSDYDKCISQIKGMACSKWDVPQTSFGTVTPPASCDNALAFGE